jgi:O-antigen/teichoic acid export membrane protein
MQPPPATARRHLSGSILSVGVSRGATLVAVAVTSIAITRMLGPSGIGTYAISFALLYVFTVLFEVGISQGTAYYVGRGEWSGRALGRGVILACLALGTAAGIAALLAYAAFGDHVPGMTWGMALALAIAMPFSLLWRTGPQAALGQERFELFALFDSAAMLIACPLSIGGAIAGTAWAVIGMSAAMVITGTLIAAWLLRSGEAAGHVAAPPRGMRSVVSLGSRAWGSELLQQVNLRADLVLLGGFAGAAEGGVYSVALSTTSIAWILTEAFAISALPRSARLQAETERAVLEPTVRDSSDSRILRHAVLVIPAVAAMEAVLLLVGLPIFYGSAFHRSIGLGFILLAGSLTLGVGRAALSMLLARGFANRVLAVGLAVVPVTVIAYVLAIPSGGATAAAIVSSGSYLAYTLLAVAVFSISTGISYGSLLVPGRADVDDYRQALARLSR